MNTGDVKVRGVCLAGIATLSLLPGCLDSMWNGSKLKPLEPSTFYADARSSRDPVPDTVARSEKPEQTPYDTGWSQGKPVATLPVPFTRQLVDRGQERFNIYCSPCHGRTGEGNGMIVQRGFPVPPSYYTERLRNAPVGHFFDVMTHGYGVMYSYSDRVSVPDRWAICAYIRVLQRSRGASINDVPDEARAKMEGGAR